MIDQKTEADITLTLVDEAPRLASYSLFQLLKKFLSLCGISVEKRDISLAGRILAQFPERLTKQGSVSDDLHYLGELAKPAKPTLSNYRTLAPPFPN